MTDSAESPPPESNHPPGLPPEARRRGCLGWAALILGGLLAAFGLMTLISSGLCTVMFALNQGISGLVLWLPSMLVSYGVWRLGKWLFQWANRKPGA